MQPMKVPREPTAGELMALKRAYLPKHLHETWLTYIDVDMLDSTHSSPATH